MPIPDIRPPTRTPRGAGGPFILVLIAATTAGLFLHQPTIGFLIGLGLGLVIALFLWRRDQE